MFDRGVRALLEHLPQFETLDPDVARRLLTLAYLDVIAVRDLGGNADALDHAQNLRRLATALELHAIMAPGLDDSTVRACAFVAAEALEVHRELLQADLEIDEPSLGGVSARAYASIEAGALYSVAAYDANAAVAARELRDTAVDDELPEAQAVRVGLSAIRALFELRQRRAVDLAPPPEDLPVSDQVRWEIWRRIASAADQEVASLQEMQAADQDGAGRRLRSLADLLGEHQRHADLEHIAFLVGEAADRMGTRALRAVPPPVGDEAIWRGYVERRIRDRPLLWPAAQEYADAVLPELRAHAVVAVPTGAGKSAVAELAIANALSSGWVLYLAPTNALVAQVMRDLEARFAEIDDVHVRAFVGAEYSEIDQPEMQDLAGHQIMVMTPEKCSLALRHSPGIFQGLRLLVMDECHLLGEHGSRGVIAELVVAEVLHRARNAVVLLLSALVSNPEELAAWLETATGLDAVTIREPWRPTRTVRAILGLEPDGSNEAFAGAVAALEQRPNRRRWSFEAPVALLASLQGAWSGASPNDYAIVSTALTAPLTAVRTAGGRIEPDRTGYVNEMASRLTARLAQADHRVLTFLPANKHHSFSVARDTEPLEPRPQPNARSNLVEALMDLAEDELGVQTVLRDLIPRGVAVHTSAMLRDEQRASEIAFRDGLAVALFATQTMAQGLNLPATAVVIGGTRVGHDPTLPAALREERARAQLLNALGRAGRAYVSSRSLGVVIPDRWVVIRAPSSASHVREGAAFLAHEDASTEVRSQIEGLIDSSLTGEGILVDRMSDEEQTAFAFLGMGDQNDAREVIRRSFGAYRVGVAQDEARAERVAASLAGAGSSFIELAGAPGWIGRASHAAGLSLPATAALYTAAAPRMQDVPANLTDWVNLLVQSLGDMRPEVTGLAIPQYPFQGTRVEALFTAQPGSARRAQGAELLGTLARQWMDGTVLTEIAGTALGEEARNNPGRGSGNPLPKTIALVDNGLGFGVARAAGALAALGRFGSEYDEQGAWNLAAADNEILDMMPVAVRAGCNSPSSLAWHRWAVRRRRPAHILARVLPPPANLAGDALSDWVGNQWRSVLAGEMPDGLTADEVALIEALRLAERA